jgi:demethylmenaquinone methyltransferase/2-methoxy-6-polyprenyl-1,4-benzoquinol methylase
MSEKIRGMFSRISGNYDLMNHLMSQGLDRRWRAEAAREAISGKGGHRVLDLATGTGDLAIAVYNEAKTRGKKVDITATDFSREMLDLAIAKSKKAGIDSINFRMGDSVNTGDRDRSFEVVTSGFSLRSYEDIGAFLYEVHRILEVGGRFVFLDLAYPDRLWQRLLFRAYSKVILFFGMFVDEKAYAWLVSSMMRFNKKAFLEKVRAKGFRNAFL